MSLASPAGMNAGSGGGAPGYARRHPEKTLLYRLVAEHYPAFDAHLAAQGAALPRHVAREFDDFLACGRLEHGFLRVACDGCRAEHLVAFSCKRRGFRPSCGARLRIIACIEDRAVIEKILSHLQHTLSPLARAAAPLAAPLRRGARAPRRRRGRTTDDRSTAGRAESRPRAPLRAALFATPAP